MKLNGIGLAINKEDKFNVPTHNDYRTTGENEEVTPFFFKENNEIKETGKCYYAILSTEKDTKDVNRMRLHCTVVSILLSLKVMKVTRLIHYVSSRNIVKSTCKLRTTRIS